MKSIPKSMVDLNELPIVNADGPDKQQEHFDGYAEDDSVVVLFKHLEKSLIYSIKSADIVVGCVAWLTNENILRALSTRRGVALVVQKEDFLRPDLNTKSNFSAKLRRLYESLPGTLTRCDEGLRGTTLHMMSFSGDYRIEAVRCVGNYNNDKHPAFPRMHHKFVVFCRCRTTVEDVQGDLPCGMVRIDTNYYEPYQVWTGSFNFTENAVRSFENALIIRDHNIVQSYFKEFGQVAALSEPLDWRSIWSAPEWRIGT